MSLLSLPAFAQEKENGGPCNDRKAYIQAIAEAHSKEEKEVSGIERLKDGNFQTEIRSIRIVKINPASPHSKDLGCGNYN
jgi:hypothetical protein